jgi:hypothetical protein
LPHKGFYDIRLKDLSDPQGHWARAIAGNIALADKPLELPNIREEGGRLLTPNEYRQYLIPGRWIFFVYELC